MQSQTSARLSGRVRQQYSARNCCAASLLKPAVEVGHDCEPPSLRDVHHFPCLSFGVHSARLSPVFPLSTARFGRRGRHIRTLEGYQGPKLRIELLVVGHHEGYELCPVEKLNRALGLGEI